MLQSLYSSIEKSHIKPSHTYFYISISPIHTHTTFSFRYTHCITAFPFRSVHFLQDCLLFTELLRPARHRKNKHRAFDHTPSWHVKKFLNPLVLPPFIHLFLWFSLCSQACLQFFPFPSHLLLILPPVSYYFFCSNNSASTFHDALFPILQKFPPVRKRGKRGPTHSEFKLRRFSGMSGLWSRAEIKNPIVIKSGRRENKLSSIISFSSKSLCKSVNVHLFIFTYIRFWLSSIFISLLPSISGFRSVALVTLMYKCCSRPWGMRFWAWEQCRKNKALLVMSGRTCKPWSLTY